MKFKKKPIFVEAMQFKLGNENEIMKWAHFWLSPESNSITTMSYGKLLVIITPEGTMYVSVDEWIVKGANGEFYHVKPDIFEKTYEAVSG